MEINNIAPQLTLVERNNVAEYGGNLYNDASIIYDSVSVYYGGVDGGVGKANLAEVDNILPIGQSLTDINKTQLQIIDSIKPSGNATIKL